MTFVKHTKQILKMIGMKIDLLIWINLVVTTLVDQMITAEGLMKELIQTLEEQVSPFDRNKEKVVECTQDWQEIINKAQNTFLKINMIVNMGLPKSLNMRILALDNNNNQISISTQLG